MADFSITLDPDAEQIGHRAAQATGFGSRLACGYCCTIGGGLYKETLLRTRGGGTTATVFPAGWYWKNLQGGVFPATGNESAIDVDGTFAIYCEDPGGVPADELATLKAIADELIAAQ